MTSTKTITDAEVRKMILRSFSADLRYDYDGYSGIMILRDLRDEPLLKLLRMIERRGYRRGFQAASPE